jgi:hypothetical protein
MLPPMRVLPIVFSLPLVLACGDDSKSPADTTDTTDTADTVEPDTDTADTSVDPAEVFVFGAAPGQSMGDGPFPSNALLGTDGLVDLAPLKNDARFGDIARDDLLDRTDAQIAKKGAFGFVSSVYFPMDAEPDLATFDGAAKFVVLSGPDAGRIFPGEASWFAPTRTLSVFPAWGEYLVPGWTYGVYITAGVKTKDGTVIQANADFAAVTAAGVAQEPQPSPAYTAFAPLRDHLATIDGTAVIGTVFTTEATLPWFDALISAASSWPLEAPSRVVAYTTAGEPIAATDFGPTDLDGFFGVPAAPFATMPTAWGPGSRASAADLPDGVAYTGGSFHGQVGYVVNGSLVMPSFSSTMPRTDLLPEPIEFESGVPTVKSRVMVPFTAYFCEEHLDGNALDSTATVPFAIFTHGGTAIRSDALPFAVANCEAGYATIALDLPFHGGRQSVVKVGDLIATSRVDDENTFSGKTRGDEGFVPDHIGDNGSATSTVGNLFALANDFDPDILEANLIAISVEHIVLTRYLRDPTKLAALFGVNVDMDRLVTQSLSFGTSFTTAALTHPAVGVKGVVQSVGSGGMLSLNLPIAPNNASLASGILVSILGLKSTIPEVMAGAWKDPYIALTQWLSQRGDPQGYAPFVLKHRASDRPAFHVFGSGDSWDETLSSLAQLSFNAAWGVPVFTAGAAWTLDATIPGADTVTATAWTAPVSNNLTAPGGPFSAAYFYNAASCHAQVVTPICDSNYLPPYPPATPRTEPLVSVSPVCALHTPMIEFLGAIKAGTSPQITAPRDNCDDLYGK